VHSARRRLWTPTLLLLLTQKGSKRHGAILTGALVWRLRKRWDIPAIRVKTTPTAPARWENGSYSVQGAAAILGVYPGTIYHWLWIGRLQGVQIAKGMPWQIRLSADQITALRAYVAQAKRSKREAL